MSELASYLRQNCSPWWSRYVSMRKSGQRTGGEAMCEGSGEAE